MVDPARAEGFWPARLFPSYASIDRARFPAAEVLVEELRDARFESVRVVAFKQPVRHRRDLALTLLRERFTSTFALLPEDEYRGGLARAECDGRWRQLRPPAGHPDRHGISAGVDSATPG